MPRFDQEMLSRYEEIPAAERRPGGPTHRLKPIAAPPIQLPMLPDKPKQAAGPNKTELEARAILRLPEESAEFEGRTFDICGGAKYTPDWFCDHTCVEAKGEHIHSRDSRRRFDEAKHLYPQFTWIWARKRTKGVKGTRWEIEVYPDNAEHEPRREAP